MHRRETKLQLLACKMCPFASLRQKRRGDSNRAEAVHKPVSRFRAERKAPKGAGYFHYFSLFLGGHWWLGLPLLAIKGFFNYQFGAESRKLFSSIIVTRK